MLIYLCGDSSVCDRQNKPFLLPKRCLQLGMQADKSAVRIFDCI